MIKAVIVDDELLARNTLSQFILKLSKDIEIVGAAESAKEGFEMIEKYQPNVVFLDVEMPGGNGFDLLSMFEKISFQIIFTTAFDHYAIKAIKFSALDYILKPIDPDELKKAIGKAIENRQTIDGVRVPSLLEQVKEEGKVDRIVLPHRESFITVELKKIILLKANGNYTNFILEDLKAISTSKTLRTYENLLINNGFIRIHRSAMINLKHIVKYTKGDGGIVTMSNGEIVKVSRHRKADFLREYK